MAQPQGNPKQIDPSTVPPAVRRAAEEADRIQREAIAAATNPEAAAPQELPRPTNPEPDRNPEPAPAPTNPEPAPVTPQGNSDDPNDQTWEQRFRSEQGRTQKLRSDVANLSGEVSNLRNLLATMQSSTAPAAEMKFEPTKLITPEEEKEWGPEFMSVVEKKARELVEPLRQELQQRIEQLDGRVNSVGENLRGNARERMLQALDSNERIKGWREINTDQGFVEWLSYPDPLSGTKRHDMLLQAFNANDASRVAAFFANFLREVSPTAPQTQGQPGQGAQPQAAPPPRPSLETFAAPGRAASGSAPSPGAGDKTIITTADIARFYADRAAGKLKGREKEAEAYERDIFAAQAEGRIRPA